ncbi:MAG: type II secretion system F family protein, partial [Planctomycetes bacterium]|nr:type II secretion system F family protein [Planctomycetota bacterium]
SRFSGRITRNDIEKYTRELGNLLASGLSLSRALKIIGRETSKPAAKKLWSDVHDNVANGTSLADAFRQWPRCFSTIYIAMVQAGETGGFLELVLGQIADFRSREQDLRSRVQAALIYPLILTILAIMILLFLLIYFIPRFSSIFAEFGGTLPPLTRGIVATSVFVMKYWFFIAGVIVLMILIAKSYLKRPEGKATFERVLLKMPILGSLIARFAFVRFGRMLGTLLNAGVPLLSALHVAKEAIGNKTLSNALDDAIERVRKGTPLAQSLRQCPQLFSGSNIEMISIAEESSRLGQELSRLAEVNEKELDRNLKTAVSFAEPAMLFFMAAFVGTIVIGMLLPIFNLQELIH